MPRAVLQLLTMVDGSGMGKENVRTIGAREAGGVQGTAGGV